MHFLDIVTFLGLDIITEGLLTCCFYFAIAEVKSLRKLLFGKNAKYIIIFLAWDRFRSYIAFKRKKLAVPWRFYFFYFRGDFATPSFTGLWLCILRVRSCPILVILVNRIQLAILRKTNNSETPILKRKLNFEIVLFVIIVHYYIGLYWTKASAWYFATPYSKLLTWAKTWDAMRCECC